MAAVDGVGGDEPRSVVRERDPGKGMRARESERERAREVRGIARRERKARGGKQELAQLGCAAATQLPQVEDNLEALVGWAGQPGWPGGLLR